jgi:hypothetical protein
MRFPGDYVALKLGAPDAGVTWIRRFPKVPKGKAAVKQYKRERQRLAKAGQQ